MITFKDMETSQVKVGDKITLSIKNYRQVLKVTGIVKDIRKSFGHEEYLLAKTTTNEFWTRKTNVK